MGAPKPSLGWVLCLVALVVTASLADAASESEYCREQRKECKKRCKNMEMVSLVRS